MVRNAAAKEILLTGGAVSWKLPVFKLTCRSDAKPHPFLGRVIYSSDPGRALITGKCADIGAITMGQFRGLAARAPYFSNGSAKDLMSWWITMTGALICG